MKKLLIIFATLLLSTCLFVGTTSVVMAEEVATETPNEVETDNTGEIIEQLTNRVAELETQISALLELKEAMEAYTKKQAEQFGYEGKMPGAKKDYKDMSASELSNELKSEI